MALEALNLLCTHLRSPEDLYSLTIKFSHFLSSLSEIINELSPPGETTQHSRLGLRVYFSL